MNRLSVEIAQPTLTVEEGAQGNALALHVTQVRLLVDVHVNALEVNVDDWKAQGLVAVWHQGKPVFHNGKPVMVALVRW